MGSLTLHLELGDELLDQLQGVLDAHGVGLDDLVLELVIEIARAGELPDGLHRPGADLSDAMSEARGMRAGRRR